MAERAYAALEKLFAQLIHLNDVEMFLHWDSATMMAPGSSTQRAEHLATLKTIHHSMLTNPVVAEQLNQADQDNSLDPWQQANLREMKRRWKRATAVNEEVVKGLTISAARCEIAWRTARENNEFSTVAPLLDEVLKFIGEQADALSDALGCTAYDALLDAHSPGLRTTQLDHLFGKLGADLPELLGNVMEAQSAQEPHLHISGVFPKSIQRRIGIHFMERIGFDFAAGRLDISTHPFSSGRGDDLRITTRYDETNFASGLMAILHETGHALYEKNLPDGWQAQPVGQSRGMDIHESQSLLIEMQACRSLEFISYAAPVLAAAYGGNGPAWQADNISRLYRVVKPDLIRVDADEVTYPLHIILRYELELAMLTGDLKVADLPGAWIEGMKRHLGIASPDDQRGCLQDIHWYDGAWGYFPSYTLGAMTAAQLYQAAVSQKPEIPTALSRGEFGPLMGWLRENVHSLGSRFDTRELIERATGEQLNPKIFMMHLQQRYLS